MLPLAEDVLQDNTIDLPVHPDPDVVDGLALDMLLDLIAGNPPADCAEHGHRGLAAATAQLMADDSITSFNNALCLAGTCLLSLSKG